MTKKTILCLIQNREHLLFTLLKSNAYKFIIDDKWDISILKKVSPSLILSIGESDERVYQIFCQAKELMIPTLNIQDGVPEYRDIWENPQYSYGKKYFNRQFMVADKIACHGYLQAALFSSWGMGEKVEIIGVPWFEKYKSFNKSPDQAKYMLIMTANKPAFTQEQYDKLKESITDLHNYILTSDWKPIWRCRGKIVDDLDFLKEGQIFENYSLYDILKVSKAAISTPSTTIVEAMLSGVPVAKLDYTNSPSFINTAWNIISREQIETVIEELKHPSPQKLNFQESVCDWLIDNSFNYSSKLLQLIEKMIFWAERASKTDNKLKFPGKLLEFNVKENLGRGYELKELFPGIDSFWNSNLNDLRVENQYLKLENARLKGILTYYSPFINMKNFVKRFFK